MFHDRFFELEILCILATRFRAVMSNLNFTFLSFKLTFVSHLVSPCNSKLSRKLKLLLIREYNLLLGVIHLLKSNTRHSGPSCNITCKCCLLLGMHCCLLCFRLLPHLPHFCFICSLFSGPHLHYSWEISLYHPTLVFLHSWDCISSYQFLLHLGSLVVICLLSLAAVDIWLQFGKPLQVPYLKSALDLTTFSLIGMCQRVQQLICSLYSSLYEQCSAKQNRSVIKSSCSNITFRCFTKQWSKILFLMALLSPRENRMSSAFITHCIN